MAAWAAQKSLDKYKRPDMHPALLVELVAQDTVGEAILVEPVVQDTVGEAVLVEPVAKNTVDEAVLVEPIAKNTVGEAVLVEPVAKNTVGDVYDDVMRVQRAFNDTLTYNVGLHEAIQRGEVQVRVKSVTQNMINAAGAALPVTPDWNPTPRTYPPGSTVLVVNAKGQRPVSIVPLTSELKRKRDEEEIAERLGRPRLDAAAMQLVEPTVRDYSSLIELNVKRHKETIAMWSACENRDSPPQTFDGHVQVRREPVNVDMIFDFMSRIACRRAYSMKRGSFFKDLRYLVLRIIPDSITGGVGIIKVLYQHENKHTELDTRWFTGLGKLPTVVAFEIHEWFKHELQAKVTRSKMARGAFSFGILVKLVARQGLNIVDGDQVRCFIQQRWENVDHTTRHEKFSYYSQYMRDPDALCAKLATDANMPESEVKRLIIIATNGGGNACTGHLGAFLEGIFKDTSKMMHINDTMRPELLQHFKALGKADPSVSALAAVDWHYEHQTTKRFDSETFANEWDGVVAFVSRGAEKNLFVEMCKRAYPIKLSLKSYDDPVCVAKRRFPDLNWEEKATISAKIYMDKFSEVAVALQRGPARVRAIDTVVAEILQGQENTAICKSEDDKGYQIFKNGQWDTSVDFKGLCKHIKQRLVEVFGTHYINTSGEEITRPPVEPLQNDSFIEKIGECFVKYLPTRPQRPLDWDLWHKILFSDNVPYVT
jgi:hypothetical protein